MSGCGCRRDPDTGEYLCHRLGRWVPECPMDGVERDEDGFLIDTKTNNENNNEEDEDEE